MLVFLYRDDSISELLEPEVITACPSLIQFAPQILRNGIAISNRDHTPCTGERGVFEAHHLDNHLVPCDTSRQDS